MKIMTNPEQDCLEQACPEAGMISIVVPVFNEEAALTELIQRTLDSVTPLERPFELILVDDGSNDKSVDIIQSASVEHPNQVIGILLNKNYGQHSAIMAGFAHVRGEFIITLDADLQNPPEEIPSIMDEFDKGHDVIGTIRQNRQDTFFRRYASKLVNKMVRKFTGVGMSDYGCMLRGYHWNVVQAMLQCHERSTFIPVLANSFARNNTEIPVAHAERTLGVSKYSFFDLINLQFDLLTSMTTFPLRMLSFVGGGIAFLGFIFAFALLVMRLIFGSDWGVDGVFPLFAILFIFVGAQFIGIGLLGEFIGRIYHDVRARPRYFIHEITGRETPN